MILTVTLNTSVDKFYRISKLTPYEVMRVSDVRTTAGGKGLNVARAAALAGEEAVAMGFVGGFNGKLFTSLLPDYIGTRFTQVKAETRSCINVWDQQNNRSTEFLEPGNPVTEEELRRFLSDFEHSLPDAEVVALSGSLPKGVPEDFYGQLVELSHRYKKYVILDSSGSSLKKAIAAKPDLIKPNTDEIRQLTNADISSREQLICAAQQLGVSTVAISQGADGVLVVSGKDVWQGVPPKITAVNTVGCGDCMVGGFAVGAARRMQPEERIRFAVAVSAANALCEETGSFDMQTAEKIMPEVRIQKLS